MPKAVRLTQRFLHACVSAWPPELSASASYIVPAALQASTTLARLSLSDCDISTYRHAVILGSALEQSSSLQELHIWQGKVPHGQRQQEIDNALQILCMKAAKSGRLLHLTIAPGANRVSAHVMARLAENRKRMVAGITT